MVKSHRIYIDGESVEPPDAQLTGRELAALVTPAAENIWLDLPDAQDIPIAPDEQIQLEKNARFFTDRPRTIVIDKVPYVVRAAALTSTQLRHLPTPPVPDDLGIWLDVDDDLDDPIEDGEIVVIRDGDRYFTREIEEREFKIYINGRPRTVERRRMTYERVVKLAYPDGPFGENYIYTAGYSKAAGPKPTGSLVAGGFVKVKDGTKFDVAFTDKS